MARRSDVTKDSKLKKVVRARMGATNENFTTALRAELAKGQSLAPSTRPAVEPHYAFTPPRTIEHVDARGRRLLGVPEHAVGFDWGYAGSGPNAASWAVLHDATGDAHKALAIAFTDDNLDWFDEIGHKAFVITLAEVRAWRDSVEPAIRRKQQEADAAGGRVTRLSDGLALLSDYQAAATAGARKPWWQTYRDVHGEPAVG
jgi:hypothetical protein